MKLPLAAPAPCPDAFPVAPVLFHLQSRKGRGRKAVLLESLLSGMNGAAELHFPAPPAPGASELHRGCQQTEQEDSAMDKVRGTFPCAWCRVWELELIPDSLVKQRIYVFFLNSNLQYRCGGFFVCLFVCLGFLWGGGGLMIGKNSSKPQKTLKLCPSGEDTGAAAFLYDTDTPLRRK